MSNQQESKPQTLLEEIEVSDSSSEEIHPNIDKKSYKNWKKQMADEQKSKLKKRLDELNKIKKLTEDQLKEKEKLEAILKPKYISKNENEFRILSNDLKRDDYSDELIYLLKNTNLESFIELISTSKIDLNVFEDFVLYNISENIKEGCDELGLKLSRISIFIGYIKNNGSLLVSRLCDELKNPEKMEIFETDVARYYEESKKAILNMK